METLVQYIGLIIMTFVVDRALHSKALLYCRADNSSHFISTVERSSLIKTVFVKQVDR